MKDRVAAASSDRDGTRPFGLLDVMVLIAAIATGAWAHRMSGWPRLFQDESWTVRIFGAYWVALPYLVTLTVAVLVLHVRRPRPDFSQLARRPGMVACLAASVVILGQFAWLVAQQQRGVVSRVHYVQQSVPYRLFGTVERKPWIAFLGSLGDCVGYAVLTCWLVLALAGLWRPVPTWIDRLGRIIGACWLVSLVLFWVLSLLLFWSPHFF